MEETHTYVRGNQSRVLHINHADKQWCEWIRLSSDVEWHVLHNGRGHSSLLLEWIAHRRYTLSDSGWKVMAS